MKYDVWHTPSFIMVGSIKKQNLRKGVDAHDCFQMLNPRKEVIWLLRNLI